MGMGWPLDRTDHGSDPHMIKGSKEQMELERGVVFTLAGLPVTTTVVTTWGMLVVLCAAAVLAGKRLRERP